MFFPSCLGKIRHKHLKCFSKCMEITPCYARVFLDGTRSLKRIAGSGEMILGAGTFNKQDRGQL